MQYSLRVLAAVTAAAAILSAIYFVLPDRAAILCLFVISLAIPPVAIPLIVYGRDDVRAFAIGVVSSGVPSIAFWYSSFIFLSGSPLYFFEGDFYDEMANGFAWKLFFVVLHGATVLSGLLSVGIRHWCLARSRRGLGQ